MRAQNGIDLLESLADNPPFLDWKAVRCQDNDEYSSVFASDQGACICLENTDRIGSSFRDSSGVSGVLGILSCLCGLKGIFIHVEPQILNFSLSLSNRFRVVFPICQITSSGFRTMLRHRPVIGYITLIIFEALPNNLLMKLNVHCIGCVILRWTLRTVLALFRPSARIRPGHFRYGSAMMLP